MSDSLAVNPIRADSASARGCYHCGGPLGSGARSVTVSEREERVCGEPCRTAVETIAGAGLKAWYRLRSHDDADGAVTDERMQAAGDAWRVPEVAAAVVRGTGEGKSAVTLTVAGMRCAGCAWLVERLLTSIDGVLGAEVDFARRRAEVRFDTHAADLPDLIEALGRAGYQAAPYSSSAEEAALERERRALLRGIGIASVFAMQVMLLSVALYAGAHFGIEPRFEHLLRCRCSPGRDEHSFRAPSSPFATVD